MDKAMMWAKLVLMGSAALLVLALALFVLQMREALVTTEVGVNGLVTKASGTIDTMNATLEHVNRPCKGLAGPDACGTLAQVNKSVIQIGDLVKTTQIQTSQLAVMVGQYGTVLQGVAGDIHTTTTALTGTANAATVTIAAVKPPLDSANVFIQHLDTETQPTINQANLFLANANTIATNPNVPLLLGDAHQFMLTGNHMLLTGDQVETKLASCTLHPHTTCYIKPTLLFGAQLGGYLLH